MSDSEFNDSDEEINDLEVLSAALKDEEATVSSPPREAPTAGSSSCADASVYGEYSKIEVALSLNRLLDEKMRKLESILQDRLLECRRRLAVVQSSETERFDREESFRYVNCGKPYFKDKFGFSAPDNEDTTLMNRSNMFNFTNIPSVPGWTMNDKTQLNKIILKLAKEKRKQEIISHISRLNRENKSLLHTNQSKTKKNCKLISELKKKLTIVDKMNLKELAGPLDVEYDWDYIANKLSNRHNAHEYRALWKLFLHPSINKRTWTRTEHVLLQKIAHEKELQDWDAINRELGTGRTNFQCFVYFRTNMNASCTNQKWTKDEEQYLMRLIEYYREDNYIPWGKVANAMDNRTKVQVYNKYSRLCELRKGKFLPEEDSVILTCIDHFGLNFRKVQEHLYGRSITQCRERYQVLKRRRYSAVWTVDEDKKLIQLMSNQDESISFATASKHFPGKDRVNIRTRYVTLCRWMRRNPHVDISHAPRRGSRRLGGAKSEANLNRAIENLKRRLKSEVIDKKRKKLTKDSPEDLIDDAIVAVLTTENVRQMEAQRLLSSLEEQDSIIVDGEIHNCNVGMLQKLLVILKAKLNKQKFANSVARNTYQGLLDLETVPNTVQVRSYSKKNAVKNLGLDKKLDIWGKNTLGQLTYVLPPHYATLTGIKKLLSFYVNPKKDSDELKYFTVLLRRNDLVKENFAVLMERFNTLFLWPMILSGAPPDHYVESNTRLNTSLETTEKKVFDNQEEFTFFHPRPNLKMLKNEINMSENIIDLEESDSKDDYKVDINFDTID